MDQIKRLTTAALQEIEDGKPVEALILLVAAIEEMADSLDVALEQTFYPIEYTDAELEV